MRDIKGRLADDVKVALKAGDKPRVGALRFVLAAIKQREIDERVTLDEPQTMSVLSRLAKQRQESIEQFRSAGRKDLVERETFELELIKSYLPAAPSDAEIEALIDEAITATGARGMKGMGAVMGWLKARLEGRADLGDVGAKVKQRLGQT
jgi:uncharacterized protein YqeY